MEKARPTRLRLTFNFRSGTTSRDTIRGFASALIEQVAIEASDDVWETIKLKISKQLQTDVKREVTHMGQLFKQLVIGLDGSSSGASGRLTTYSRPAKGREGLAMYSFNVGWPERSENYLRRKMDSPPYGVGHDGWFLHKTKTLLSTMGKSDTWIGAYGPIKVDVRRTGSMSRGDANRSVPDEGSPGKYRTNIPTARFDTGVSNTKGSIVRVQVASVRVSAMEDITPAMLPAIRHGDIDQMANDGRTTGLIGQFPSEIAYRLGGNRKFVPYRHTVEPFLGFFLTRALPNAVARRFQETLGEDIKLDTVTRSDMAFGGKGYRKKGIKL
jgi:hypothetical protein